MAPLAKVSPETLRPPRAERRLASSSISSRRVILLIALLALGMGRPDFLDLALAYALINFIGVLAVLEFFQIRSARATPPGDEP